MVLVKGFKCRGIANGQNLSIKLESVYEFVQTDGKKAHEFPSIHTHARTQCLVERISFCNPLIYAINVHVVVV